MSRRIETLCGALLFVLLLLVVLLVPTGGASNSTAGSVANSDEGGRYNCLRLLEELKFESSSWRDAPGKLPRGGALLWLAVTPASAVDPKPEGGDRSMLGREHDPAAYSAFIERGGTLVLPFGEATAGFLGDDLGYEECLALAYERGLGRDSVALELLDDDAGYLASWPRGSGFTGHEGGAFEQLLSDENGRALALELSVGRGRLVLLGDDAWLDNEQLDEAEHALLFVRVVQRLTGSAGVLFDEYALGRWRAQSSLDLALSPRFIAVSLHLVVLFLFFMWRHAWVAPFARDPQPLDAVSPIARPRAVASLFERARRTDLLAEPLRFGFLSALARRLRIPLPRRVEGESQRSDAAELVEAIGARVGLADDMETWRDQLLGRQARPDSDLRVLMQQLEAFELQVVEHAGRSSGVLPPGSPGARPVGSPGARPGGSPGAPLSGAQS